MLKIIFLLIITNCSYAKIITIKNDSYTYFLTVKKEKITLLGNQINLKMIKDSCNKNIFNKLHNRLNVIFDSTTLKSLNSKGPLEVGVNSKKYFLNYNLQISNNIVLLPDEMMRAKIQDHFHCKKSNINL